MKNFHWSLRFFVFLLITFVIVIFDFLTISIQPTFITAPLNFFAVALVNASLLFLAVSLSTASGWRLFLVIFLAYYALTGFLVGIETVYLPEQLPLDIAIRVLINAGIAAILLTGISIYFFGDKGKTQTPNATARKTSWISWLWKLFLSGIVWMFLFVLVGLFVFQPLAKALDEPAAIQYLAEFSGNQDDGIKILLFQIGRGIIWAVMILPWLISLRVRRWHAVLLAGGVCAGWLGSTFFTPTGIPALIQIAHLVEMITENFLYGAWLGFLFFPKKSST